MKITDNKALFYSSIGVVLAILILILINTILFKLAKRKIDQMQMPNNIFLHMNFLEKQRETLNNLIFNLKKRNDFYVEMLNGFFCDNDNASFYIQSKDLFGDKEFNYHINKEINSLIRDKNMMPNSLIFREDDNRLSTENPHDLQKKLNIEITEDQKNDFKEKKIQEANSSIASLKEELERVPNDIKYLYRDLINTTEQDLQNVQNHIEEISILRVAVGIIFNNLISKTERDISEIESTISKIDAKAKEIGSLAPPSFFNPINNIKILNIKILNNQNKSNGK